jgi:DNA polymerase
MIHLDYETTSACDISLGHYRYACDPSTRILMFAVGRGTGTPVIWRFDDPAGMESSTAKAILRKAIADGDPIYAHNAAFELATSHYRLMTDVGLQPPALSQWRCTKALALRAAIPASLAGAASFLKLTDKDKVGRALIGVFSDQTKLVTITRGKEKRKVASPILLDPVPWDWTFTLAGETVTVADAWHRFIEYCRTDVVVERQVHEALASFDSESELGVYQFDLRMNHLGIPVNVDALEKAEVIRVSEEQRMIEEFRRITALNPSQTAKVLEWLQGEGYPGDNLQAGTMEQCLGNKQMSDKGTRALQIRADLSFAAVKKIPSMIKTACPDGRMRGLLNYYGAQRTGRWTSSGPQVQNAKKPTISSPDHAYKLLCDGHDRDTLESFFGNPYEILASCVRNFIQPHSGMLLDVDYANIESRVAAWLAGCDSELDLYRQGKDAYKQLASETFGVPVEEVTKDQRFVGKVGVLSLVFETGAKTFYETCASWGNPIDKRTALRTVKAFRETKPEFPATWRSYEKAASNAIKNPGEWFDASPFVKIARTKKGPFDRMLMRLPSGRDIVFPLPEIHRAVKSHRDFETGEVRQWETDEISFFGPDQKTTQWGRVTTYSGKLFQGSVQGTARDIIAHGCLNAERQGFKIVALIHDEAIAEDGDLDQFITALCDKPPWMPQDFPLAAEGDRIPYYSK